MDISDFYDVDPRRRGDDVLFGTYWRDRRGRPWRVSWIPRTRELVAIYHPEPWGWANLGADWGDGYSPGWLSASDMAVEVLAVIEDEARLAEIFHGSEPWAVRRGALERLHRRLRRQGLALSETFGPSEPKGCLFWVFHPSAWVNSGAHPCSGCSRTVMARTRRCPFCGEIQPRYVTE